MPRLKLQPRDSYPFEFRLTVRTTDLNHGGHLGNDRLLALVQEARVAWLAGHGWRELDCAGVGVIMTDAAVVYQGEAFAGDELRFEVAAGDADGKGFRLYYRVTRPGAAGSAATPIALAETGLVAFDYGTRRVTRLPAAVRAVCDDG
jgi:acyl-CoA thioester hydrolase